MGIRIEYTDNAQAMLKHMILLTILCAACAVDNRANGQKLIDDLLAADVEGLASETCASYAPPSASATYDTPLKPPTNTKGLIPQGVGVLYANLTANPLPTSLTAESRASPPTATPRCPTNAVLVPRASSPISRQLSLTACRAPARPPSPRALMSMWPAAALTTVRCTTANSAEALPSARSAS